MHNSRIYLSLLLIGLFGSLLTGKAFVHISDVLSDGMVLQRNQLVPIWGTALPGESVTVCFLGQEKQTNADMNGDWYVLLDPMAAHANEEMMEIIGINKIRIRKVVVGEVWLCAGQSNMQLILASTNNGDSVIASANYPDLHFFNVSRDHAFGHKKGDLGSWTTCTPTSVASFSAAAYYFGQALQRKLNVPVGIINASFGGSQAEAWTPRAYLASPELKGCLERDSLWANQRAEVQEVYSKALDRWHIYAQKEREAGREPKEAPHQPEALRDYRPVASIFDHMMLPLIPYGIQGVIWYQGESNEGRAEQYGYLLPTMIRAWRYYWRKPLLPFGIIQLPNYRNPLPNPADQPWSHIREAQRITADTVPGVGLIVTIDIGETHNIHPKNKAAVGRRMLLWALHDVYGKSIGSSGPVFDHITIKGSRVFAYFLEDGGKIKTWDQNALAGFAIAGSDGIWYWAKAKITSGHQVMVWNEKVKSPVAIRYAFNDNPVNQNLTNDSGLPASPFRTDNQAGPTHGER